MLCGLLEDTGSCGTPDSYFHNDTVSGWLADHGLAEADFATHRDAVTAGMQAMRRAGSTGSDLFGLRLQGAYLPLFSDLLATAAPEHSTDAARIEAVFGPARYIYLMREDKLAQAISREIAVQSGLWHRAADGSEMERLSAAREPQYDAEALRRHMAEAARHEAQWQTWFAMQQIAPLKIRYEHLSRDPVATLGQVLRAIGMDPALAQGVAPQVSKLADARNRDWAERFLAGG